ncbi:MAG: lipopolysaccharide transport periplasmic protein LptA [Deltaproteobacteria bacterium]|nr:lipopolysaccharide transport periplasmic protein LptA [Deltaproteobacteria bacterium]
MRPLVRVGTGIGLIGRVTIAAVFMVIVSGPAFGQEKAALKEGERLKVPVVITSESMEASRDEGTVVFTGNVVAIEDFTLCSDELHISYGKEKEITEMTASGRVRIFQADRKALADKAEYDRIKRTLVLTGGAEVIQCSDTVRGDRIIVHIDDEDAVVQSESGGRVKAVIKPVKNCPQPDGNAAAGAARDVKSEEARCRGSR